MRPLPAVLAALALVAALPAAAAAQTPPPAAPTQGVSVVETRAWLTGLGGSVGEPVPREGVTSLHVADQPLPWNIIFYGCGPNLCSDIQYSAVFTGPITADQVNGWNREHRFLKAYFVSAPAGGTATAVAQYDVILTTTGTAQLQEPTVIWLQLLREFAQALVADAPAAAPASQ